jgi:hypothetical protein
MALRVNASRGNLKLENGYLFIQNCRLQKDVVFQSPEAYSTATHRAQWIAELWLVSNEQDRDELFRGPNNGPLAIFRVQFGVQDGRDPLQDAFSMIRAGVKNETGWTIEEILEQVA